MSFESRRITIALCSFLLCLAVSTCGKKQPEQSSTTDRTDRKWDRERAELEYRLIQAELMLAKSEEPYMVFSLQQKQLRLKLKGAVVWNYPTDTQAADSQEVREFVERFQGSEERVLRFLSGKHLFAAQEKTPDSVLAIVGEVVKVDPELLQREVPACFQLLWGLGLILEIRTDVAGRPISRLKNTFVKVTEALHPFGKARFVMKMNPEDALTLYRAAKRGLPTLLYPPL
jgi:hypothetical protein